MFAREVDSQQPGDQSVKIQKAEGTINGKPVVEAKNQTSKGWFILAMVIGGLVVLGVGGFGIVGLIHSYGLHLSQWLQWLLPAIGTVGNTPHYWSLWVIAVSGVVGGGGLIAFGVIKLRGEGTRLPQEYQKKLDGQPEKPADKKPTEKSTEKPAANIVEGQPPEKYSDEKKQKLWALFGDNFATLGCSADEFADDFQGLPNETFSMNFFTDGSEGESDDEKFVPADDPYRFFIVIKTSEGSLKCTNTMLESEQEDLVEFLESENYICEGDHVGLAKRKRESENKADALKKLPEIKKSITQEDLNAKMDEEDKEFLNSMFGDHFAEIGIDPLKDCWYFTNHTFGRYTIYSKKCNKYLYMVRQTSKGILQCTGKITVEQRDRLATILKAQKEGQNKGYRDLGEKTIHFLS